MFIGDLLVYCISFLFIILARFGADTYWFEINRHFYRFLILYLVSILIFYIFGLYDIYKIKPTIPNLKTYVSSLFVLFIIAIIFFYFIPFFGITPKANLIYQLASFGLFSFLLRRLVYLFHANKIIKKVIMIGNTKYLDDLGNILALNPQIGLKVILHTNDKDKSLQHIENNNNMIIILEKNTHFINEDEFMFLIKNNVEILDIVNAYETYLYKIPSSYVSQNWITENINIRENMFYKFSRRFIDIIISTFILLILSPVLLLLSIVIYLTDKEKVLYKQERVGVNGKVFKLYKLRSMIIDAEKTGATWATQNDSRITPIGKIMRKTHLDEIPQMFNILKGDITFVGPRPERPEFVEILNKKIPNYKLRHIVKPGFTGWAQIKYRYARTEEDSKEKFDYDLYYIKNKNIFMDLGILLRTIQIIFSH